MDDHNSHRMAAKPPASGLFKRIVLGCVALLIPALIAGFVIWPKKPLDLGQDDNMTKAGVYQLWQAGKVAVLVRHGERCDRSGNPCLGPADGITRAGSLVSEQVGKAFKTLGLNNTDMFSSPLTRTVQTAFYMNGSAVPEKEWLGTCEQTLLSDVRTHKAPNRNLLLVTHSGCIGKFERQLDFPHAPTAEYNSALFVSVAADGTVKVLGIMNPDEWPAALGHKPADPGASPASTNGVPAEKKNPAL